MSHVGRIATLPEWLIMLSNKSIFLQITANPGISADLRCSNLDRRNHPSGAGYLPHAPTLLVVSWRWWILMSASYGTVHVNRQLTRGPCFEIQTKKKLPLQYETTESICTERISIWLP